MLPDLTTKPLPVIDISHFYMADIAVEVLRLDVIDKDISGNKWFKLRIYLEEAQQTGKKHIITFGGAWSNHILALAVFCKRAGFLCTGIIRGEEPAQFSATLKAATAAGMELVFVSRAEYREKLIPEGVLSNESYVIPEGGMGENGVGGAMNILDHCDRKYTHYACAVGTGTMMAGLIRSKKEGQFVTGISTMKNNHALDQNIETLAAVSPARQWEVLHDHHLGGYGKHPPGLIDFMNEFYKKTMTPTDIVYTGKLFLALSEITNGGYYPAGSRVLAIHSGGLQGNASLRKGTLIF